MFFICLTFILFLIIGSQISLLYQIKTQKIMSKSFGEIVDVLSENMFKLFSVYFIIQIVFVIFNIELFFPLSYTQAIILFILQSFLCRVFLTHDNLLSYFFLKFYIAPSISKIVYKTFGLKVTSSVFYLPNHLDEYWHIKISHPCLSENLIINVYDRQKPLSLFKDEFLSLVKKDYILNNL